MAGTRSGGVKAAKANTTKDPDFYRRIGSIGGKTRTAQPKGFAANPELARKAGAIGGRRSKRGVKMSEDLRKVKSKLNYAKSRVRFYERKLISLTNDLSINQAEEMYSYWMRQVKLAEKDVEKILKKEAR